MNEEWRPIPGYEGMYEISDFGNVRSLDRIDSNGRRRKGVPIHTKLDGGGYCLLHICKESKRKTFRPHVMVMLVFVGSCPAGYEVNHKDGNKPNNSLSNLEYLTRSDNDKHAFSIGLKDQAGEKNGNSRYTDDQVLEMRRLHDAGYTNKSIAKMIGCSRGNVSLVVNFKSRR